MSGFSVVQPQREVPVRQEENMDIAGSVALVTGSNRGIGRRFVTQLLERGAAKVYATARRPELVDIAGVEVLPLDITDADSVAAAAAAAQDVTLLVNNAGIATGGSLLRGDLENARREMDTHYWGTLAMIRAFAPIIEGNGGGAIVNVLSALSWFAAEDAGGYAAAKAAEWNMTNAVRLELQGSGVAVQGVHLGAADTDLMAGYEGDMIDPAEVARASLDGVERGAAEVVVDDWSALVKASLAHAPEAFYAEFAPADAR
jgi:NAD(P)-dependent dehydrogenase (short-subunit alcohol dehydrogenase family)